MFLAIHSVHVARHRDDLREFVRDRHLTLDPRFRVYAFLVPDVSEAGNISRFHSRIDFFRKSRWFDISRAKTELGFRPKTDLNTGIERTAAWYREQGYL